MSKRCDLHKLAFTTNDVTLPLHILHHHNVKVRVKDDASVKRFWWTTGEDGIVVPRVWVLVVTRGVDDGEIYNYWHFSAVGMAGPAAAKGCDTLAELDSKMKKRRGNDGSQISIQLRVTP